MDEPAAKKNLAEFKRRTKEKPLELAAALGEGVPALMTKLFKRFFPGEKRVQF